MRRGRRSSAPPAATIERLASGIPIFAPLAATIRSQDERDLQAPRDGEALDRRDQRLARGALGDPAEAAVAEPRRLALDERAEVHAGAEVAAGAGEHADRQLVVGVELVQRARATPAASAALTAFRTSGRLSVISSTLPRRSVRTGSVATAVSSALISRAPWSMRAPDYPSGRSPRRSPARPAAARSPRAAPLAERRGGASPACVARRLRVLGRRRRALADGLAKLAHALAERAGELGQALGTEHDERDDGDEQQMDGVLDAHGHPRLARPCPRGTSRARDHLRPAAYPLTAWPRNRQSCRGVPTRRPARPSPSGRPQATVLAAIGLQLLLPARLTIGPSVAGARPARACCCSACSWPRRTSSSTSTRAGGGWRSG